MNNFWPRFSIFLVSSVKWQRLLSNAVTCIVCPSPQVYFHVICVTSWIAKFVHFDGKMLVFLGNILSEKSSFLWKTHSLHQLPDFLKGCKIWKNVLFRISNMSCLYTIAYRNFLPFCQLHPCCLWNEETKVCVNICFISSSCCRMECKTGSFLPSSLPVGLIGNVPYVLLLPKTHTFWPQ
jgi:hypothetical protein